jgi:hypothetical protein
MAAGLGVTEWLASVLAAHTAPASTSTGNQTTVAEEHAEETVALQGATDAGDAVAMLLGRRRRLVLPLQAWMLTLPIQYKNTSLATKFLDNIAVSSIVDLKSNV